ncbi:MAG: substrate-binding domain-containing protein, partial [Alicyclobacillus sp.]|nr:substrate-binding domain-containing protein [Alicyclobacillus sp.]
GHITVATNRPFGRYVLPAFLTTYLRAYPQLDVAVQYETTERICRSVLEGVADVGVVSSTGQMKHPRLHISLLYRDEWCLVAAAHSPWGQQQMGLAELLSEAPLVASVEDSTNWHQIQELLREHLHLHDSDYRVRVRLDDLEAMKLLAMEGLGVAFLPRSCARSELAAGALVEIPFPHHNNPPLWFWAVTKAKTNPRPTVSEFLRHLEQYVRTSAVSVEENLAATSAEATPVLGNGAE